MNDAPLSVPDGADGDGRRDGRRAAELAQIGDDQRGCVTETYQRQWLLRVLRLQVLDDLTQVG